MLRETLLQRNLQEVTSDMGPKAALAALNRHFRSAPSNRKSVSCRSELSPWSKHDKWVKI
jgi:hypothetical protein